MTGKIKIYLDQKDYSAIAEGLCGNGQHKYAKDAYVELKNLVESGHVQICSSQ